MRPIYLDNNATTPMDPRVADAMQPFLAHFVGNASSSHTIGREARRAIESARCQLAEGLDAERATIVFTSGATEANNLAIYSAAGPTGAHILASPTEHPSCIEPLRQLASRGYQVEWLRVDSDGIVEHIHQHFRRETQLVVVQLANSETGVIQAIAQLASDRPKGCWFHCDAVQAIGKIPVSFAELGVDSMTVSGHKLHGPAGIGALILRDSGVRPLLLGGHQQKGLRPGTEPIANIVGLGQAVALACNCLAEVGPRLRELRDKIETGVQERMKGALRNGSATLRLPNTTNISFPGTSAEALVMALDLAGVCCSAGTACASGSLEPSYVLAAMGIVGDRLASAVRFCVARQNTSEEIDDAIERIAQVVVQVRSSFAE